MSEPLIQPLPWSVSISNEGLASVDASVEDANGVTLLNAITRDEAEFICRACNSYAVMVNALTMAERAFSAPAYSETRAEQDALDSIRAALAIAKGEA